MQIAYYSTFLNHHQIEFCDMMFRIHGNGFRFVSTKEPPVERKIQGFTTYNREYEFLLSHDKKYAEQLFIESDIVILGVHLDEWLSRRLKLGKITFLHQERLFKKSPSIYWWLRSYGYAIKNYHPYRNSKFYMLCASGYTERDYKRLGCFNNKCFAWGYYPPIQQIALDELRKKKESPVLKFLWAGRLLKLKKPDYALKVAEYLQSIGVNFHMDIIGDGEMRNEMESFVIEHGLQNSVNMLGMLPQETVREYMEAAHIYLFTSNREEGYGAVAIEAMNSACVIIASKTAGATPLLIKDGINGLVYHKDSVDELLSVVKKVIDQSSDITRLGENAYNTVLDIQNGIVAADRFSKICEEIIMDKRITMFEDGPMSTMNWGTR